MSEQTCRLDRWLWSVRVFKTRSQAAAACRAGRVSITGVVAKPARDVRIGDRLTVRLDDIDRYPHVLIDLKTSRAVALPADVRQRDRI